MGKNSKRKGRNRRRRTEVEGKEGGRRRKVVGKGLGWRKKGKENKKLEEK